MLGAGQFAERERASGRRVEGWRRFPGQPAVVVPFSGYADLLPWVGAGKARRTPGPSQLTGDPGVGRLGDDDETGRIRTVQHSRLLPTIGCSDAVASSRLRCSSPRTPSEP